jgi:enoyl-[acyl-carrier protein] reductase I
MRDSAHATVALKGTLMQGKRGLVMGVANERSLAWGIAAAAAAQGAELAFTFQGEALERRVRPLAAAVGSDLVIPCDVADEASIDSAFATLRERWDGIDFLVHAIGYADKNFLRGRYLDTPREAFLQAMDISCYSFVAGGADDEAGRQSADAHLHGRREMGATL